ncbi:MAG: aminoacyl-tRNA hydrolase, partial [Megasphaera micronuciformis]|nr:aminoacyl-tRNA hydrolase [Megasphaera micronuciformis]
MIAGLGNPGREYEGSKHNAGFTVIDELARRWG